MCATCTASDQLDELYRDFEVKHHIALSGLARGMIGMAAVHSTAQPGSRPVTKCQRRGVRLVIDIDGRTECLSLRELLLIGSALDKVMVTGFP